MTYRIDLDYEDPMASIYDEGNVIWYDKLGVLYNRLDILIFTLAAYDL